MVTIFNSVYWNAYVYINKEVMGYTIHLPASIFITFPSQVLSRKCFIIIIHFHVLMAAVSPLAT